MKLYESTIYWGWCCFGNTYANWNLGKHMHLFLKNRTMLLRSNSSSKNYGKWKMGISPNHPQQRCGGMPFPRVCWRVLVRLRNEFRGVNMTNTAYCICFFSGGFYQSLYLHWCNTIYISSIQTKYGTSAICKPSPGHPLPSHWPLEWYHYGESAANSSPSSTSSTPEAEASPPKPTMSNGGVSRFFSSLQLQDSQELQDLMNVTKVGDPFRFRSHLLRLAGEILRD